MLQEKQERPTSFYALMAALVVQGLSGLAGGFGLLADPTGHALGIPAAWLQGSPFSDYLMPGLILFLALCVVPILVAYGLWTRHRWSWHAALLVSVALIIWIVVEILVIGYHAHPPLQLIYGVLGLLMLGLVVLPSVRGYLMREAQAA